MLIQFLLRAGNGPRCGPKPPESNNAAFGLSVGLRAQLGTKFLRPETLIGLDSNPTLHISLLMMMMKTVWVYGRDSDSCVYSPTLFCTRPKRNETELPNPSLNRQHMTNTGAQAQLKFYLVFKIHPRPKTEREQTRPNCISCWRSHLGSSLVRPKLYPESNQSSWIFI